MANISRASAAARRHDLLAAALEEMVATGTTNIAYTSVAARCGVSTTTLYRRFETRAHLLEAAVDAHVATPVLAWTAARHSVLTATTPPDRADRASRSGVRLEPTTRAAWNLLLTDAAWPSAARRPVAALLCRSAALVDVDPDDPSSAWWQGIAAGAGSWLLATGLQRRPPPALDEVLALRQLPPTTDPSASIAAGGRAHVPDARGVGLLDATADLLTAVGYEAMGVDDVVRRARSSTGALYSRFSGKPGLLSESLSGRHDEAPYGAAAGAALVEALRVAPREPEVATAVAATVGLRRRTLLRALRARPTDPSSSGVAASTRAWVQLALPIGDWVLRRALADRPPARTRR